MKITNVEYFHLNPRLCDRYKGHEVRFSGIDTQTVYRVTLHNGVIGYGDERGHITLSEQQISALVDQSPFNYLGASLNAGLMGALYDAMGKAIDEPAYKLLGQKVRDRVPVAAWTRPAPPEDFASEITRAANEGYTIFKMHSDARHDIIEQTRAAQEVAPQGFKLHWDLNHNRPSAAVLRIVDELEKFPVVGFLEDPFFWHDIEGWRLLRSQTMLPILMHVPQLGGGPEILNGCADLYMIAEHGIPEAIKRAWTCAEANVGCVIQLTGGTLSKAMAMHLGAVVPNLSHSTNLDDQYDESVTGGRLEVDEGSTPVPEGPGLGVDVDEKELKRIAKNPKTEIPRIISELHMPQGGRFVQRGWPSTDRQIGYPEGGMPGIRLEIWEEDDSTEWTKRWDELEAGARLETTH